METGQSLMKFEPPQDPMMVLLDNFRDAPSVDQQTDVVLHTWRVMGDAFGRSYLLGFHSGSTLRMTTPIKTFDPLTGIVTTSSGRRYRLDGPPTECREIVSAIVTHGLISSIVFTDDKSASFATQSGWSC